MLTILVRETLEMINLDWKKDKLIKKRDTKSCIPFTPRLYPFTFSFE